MSLSGVNGALAGFYQYAERTRKTDTGGVSFSDKLQKAGETDNLTKEEAYKKYLEKRFGNVMIRNVGKDQKSVDALGAGTSGFNNVAIAPNIFEEMANNPQKAACYEK